MKGAPYFNLGEANNNNSLTVDDVVNALNASSISCPQIYNYNENIAYSTFYKLSIINTKSQSLIIIIRISCV